MLPLDFISISTQSEKARPSECFIACSSVSAQILFVPREDHLAASPEMAFFGHYVLIERGWRRQWCLSEAVDGKQHSPVHESSVI